MKLPPLGQLGCLLILAGALCPHPVWADPVSAVQLLRVSGCGGLVPAIQPLQLSRQLDKAAALWAAGGSPLTAAAQTGYRARQAAGLRVRGSDESVLQALRRTGCREFADEALRDIGVYRSGADTWLVVASRAVESIHPARSEPAPSVLQNSSSATRVLQLVNEVRARGTRCGDQSFGPAPALRESSTLDSVAYQHAADMARHDYFEHVDLGGHSPADRVRAIGYRERLVGENIAYGPTSAEEVVSGWLHSAGHCANIMDARFAEMGLALASGQGARHGLYWDEVLTEPAK
ncbi:MAG TPA: CAP domain-containing protein [Steroidobacteraceae bacterium]|nr:CAP domain-containing protein [Steroidobacteraceae bacterium]